MSLLNSKLSSSVNGLNNPFAKGGLPRSPPREVVTDAKGSGTPDIAMDGPSLNKAVESRRNKLPRVVAASDQLDAIIEFMAGRHNIFKDLKQSLLVLILTVRFAKEYAEFEARVEAAGRGGKEKESMSRSVQTDNCLLVGAREATEQDTHNKASAKRTRKSPGEATPGGSKKRLNFRSPQARTSCQHAAPRSERCSKISFSMALFVAGRLTETLSAQ